MIILGNDIGRQFTGIVAYDNDRHTILLNKTLNLPLAKMRKESRFNPTSYRLRKTFNFYLEILGEVKCMDNDILAVIEDYALGADSILTILKAKRKSYTDKMIDIKELVSKNDRDPLSLAEVHGAIHVALSLLEIPIIKMVPTQLKRFITGDGTADKPEMMKTLKDKYNAVLDDHHQYDALGLCHVGRYFVAYCRKPTSIPAGYERETISSIAYDNKFRDVFLSIRAKYEAKLESLD